jgi:hypothetical protein
MQNHANSWKLLDVYEIIGARKKGLVVLLGVSGCCNLPKKNGRKAVGEDDKFQQLLSQTLLSS